MSKSIYKESILRYYKQNLFIGPPKWDAKAHFRLRSNACGDSGQVWIGRDSSEKIIISIKISGCILAVAAGNIVAEMINNDLLRDFLSTNVDQLVEKHLGCRLEESRKGCFSMAIEQVQSYLKSYKS